MSSEVEEKQRKDIKEKSKEAEKTKKTLRQENAKLDKDKNVIVKEMDKLRETNGTLSKTKYDQETKLKAKDDLIKGLKEIIGILILLSRMIIKYW